ncbi:YggS family pyridoxal phosphate-dependent enzyme [Hydromonas duriensis]
MHNRIEAVQNAILNACQTAQRPIEQVQLLAVTKTHPFETIRTAYSLGLRAFGENYVQEGVDKVIAFRIAEPDNHVVWHFIGPLQSNKTRVVAEHFDWVHGVDRLKIAQRLSEQRPINASPLNVLIQVNISAEASKSGCTPESVLALAQQVVLLPRLKLRGLMTIPAAIDPTADEASQRLPFIALAKLHADLKAQLADEHAEVFDTLSMGMSDDFPHAIAAGATLIRIGSALFGTRPTKPSHS